MALSIINLIFDDSVKSFDDTINAKKLSKILLFLFNFGGDLIWRILMKSAKIRTRQNKYTVVLRFWPSWLHQKEKQ